MKTLTAALATTWLLTFATGQARAGYTATVSAYINQLTPDDFYTTTAPMTEEFFSATSEGRLATASADWKGTLKGYSGSAEGTLVNNASTSAGFSSLYTVTGNPDRVPLPLTFKVRFDGFLKAITLSNLDFAGSQVIMTAGGVIGHAGVSAILEAEFGKVTLITDGKVEDYDSTIYQIDTVLQFVDTVTTLGYLSLYLGTEAASGGPNAFGEAAFLDTAYLESITVPADFNAVDISQLSVVFDSGLTMAVTRAAAVPEPSGVVLMGIGLSLAVAHARWKSQWGTPR
jgi:hypothetical protein